MELPLISVIIPAYNAQSWIAACCQSVFEQTYSNWELIIVNDGSEDQTREILSSLKSQKENILVIHQENSGVSKARNVGIDAANGDYIMFLDADDMLFPDALQLLYQKLLETDSDLAIGWKTNMREDGLILGCPYHVECAIWEDFEGLQKSLEDHPATYAVWGKLYKKSLVEDIRFVEGKKVHEDSFFIFQCLLKKPKVILCGEIVLKYRLSENSASRSVFSEKIFDILYFADSKKELIEQHAPQMESLKQNMIIKAHMALLRNLACYPGLKYLEIERSSIKEVLQNKSFFISATKADKRWLFIIRYRLYWLYKLKIQLRKFFFRKV